MIRSTKKLSREYLCEFLADYDYPEEARVEVLANLERLLADDGATERINALLESFRDKSFDYVSTLASAKEAFEIAGVGEYEGNFIYIAHLASGARDVYRPRNRRASCEIGKRIGSPSRSRVIAKGS